MSKISQTKQSTALCKTWFGEKCYKNSDGYWEYWNKDSILDDIVELLWIFLIWKWYCGDMGGYLYYYEIMARIFRANMLQCLQLLFFFFCFEWHFLAFKTTVMLLADSIHLSLDIIFPTLQVDQMTRWLSSGQWDINKYNVSNFWVWGDETHCSLLLYPFLLVWMWT